MSDPATTETAVVPSEHQGGKGHRVVAAICLILAIVLTTPAGLAYWGQRTLNDTQRYLDTVGPLVDSPEVQEAIETTVVNAIQKQVDVEALLNEAFAGVTQDRPRLELLIGPIAGAVNGLIEREVNDFIASDTFADLWVTANARAQQALVRILQGDSTGAVSLQGDEVVLDVGDVIDQVEERLVARGLTFVENAPIPDVDKQIVLLDAPQLRQLQTIYAFSNPVAQWLIVVVAALYLAAFVLSRRRPRMTGIIGLGLLGNALLVGFALSVGRQLFINELSGTVFGPASSVFYDTLLAYLERGWHVLAWLGVLLVAAGWFAGSNGSGSAARSAVSRGLESGGESLPADNFSGVGRWAKANAFWVRYVVLALGVVALMWGNQTSPTRLFWSTVGVLAVLAGLQVLVGAASAEESGVESDAEPEPVGASQ